MLADLLVIAGVIYLGGLIMTTAYAWDKGYPVFPVLIERCFWASRCPCYSWRLCLTS